MPFYKRTTDEILVAPNSVIGPSYELQAQSHADNNYPIDGWYWFASLDDAMIFFASLNTTASVSPRQIRQALTRASLREDVESAIADSDQDTKDWWAWATSFERNHPKVAMMGTALGQTTEQLDALFALAASL